MSTTALPAIQLTKDTIKSLLEIIMESTENVMKAQCQISPKRLKAGTGSSVEFKDSISISASVSLTSDEISGTLMFAFPEKTFLGITSKVLGEEFESISDENADFAGEILNMCFGASKTKFSQVKSIVLQPSIPSVVRGNDLRPTVSAGNTKVSIIWETEYGNFLGVISFKK